MSRPSALAVLALTTISNLTGAWTGRSLGLMPLSVALEQRDHAVIDEVSRRERRLAIVELGANDLAVGVDEGLLVDAPDPLHVADIECVLGAAIARMLALELAMRLLLGLGLFQRNDLRLGQHQTVLGALGLQRLESLVHRLQIVAQPHATHASR